MTGSSTGLEADNSPLQRANDQVLKVGYIKMLDELQLKMEAEIVSEGPSQAWPSQDLSFDIQWETTAVFGRVSSGNFRQDYGYMRTSQHARLRESTVGECS